ncbi:XRE family transcriptional regulator [Leifsonia shinshuensis]|uniref:Transcriptional regulator with XRE-family HTH domain n=1 Tax=Leifsonia shinshuensis TaxID=150026 RepID=A0A853D3L5_9MICO|nr:XRE family transcriptional regulator [Leifsonia shinshuensis]NYJ25600.1 transcriptional regulator with XRE-family HTH domain [Leifsonia shinshuensis]
MSGKPQDDSLIKPARVARQFAINVRAAIADRSIREVAEVCGLEHSVVVRVLNGEQWADLVTIAKLEDGLDSDLWPRRDARG